MRTLFPWIVLAVWAAGLARPAAAQEAAPPAQANGTAEAAATSNGGRKPRKPETGRPAKTHSTTGAGAAALGKSSPAKSPPAKPPTAAQPAGAGTGVAAPKTGGAPAPAAATAPVTAARGITSGTAPLAPVARPAHTSGAPAVSPALTAPHPLAATGAVGGSNLKRKP